ncbi:MAG: ParB/RepB/Spo0J family partition protein [Firmicutes bacterium]|nr:ParB/RepB/Spo0J family partition protein [Bacillota bacterium]
METKRKALGRGLEQLFTNEVINFEKFEKDVVSSAKESDIIEISLDEIRSNPYQPRKTFNEESLNELADSIKEHGLVQPIIVKKSVKGYDLIAGERRTKASRLAGLKTIPAIIKDYNDNEMREIALVENIQRENLNPIDEAMAYEDIINMSKMTQEEFAKKFGKSRSHVTNMLGLLKLPDKTKDLIADGKISMGHARCLSKLSDVDKIYELQEKIVADKLSVRELEKIITEENLPKLNKITKKELPRNYSMFQNIMRDKIGTKVKISNKKIEIPFDSEKDLERILEILNIEIDGD